jgi:hypothetical protein
VLTAAVAVSTLTTGSPHDTRRTVPGTHAGFALAYHPLYGSLRELDRTFRTVRSTGARWVRFDFWWAITEPARGRFDWRRIDRAVQAARAHGLAIIATLGYTPKWARRAGTNDHAPPIDPDDFARFASAAVERYRPRGVRVWEIWNEPNNALFWRPKPDVAAYTALLRAVSTVMHRSDPHATVLVGGLSPGGPDLDWTAPDGTLVSPWRFLRGIYDHGGGGSFDAVGFHPYAPQPLLPSDISAGNAFQQTPDLHQLMVEHGDAAKRIWGTEAGAWTRGDGAISELQETQAVRQYLTLWNQWHYVGPFLYYELRDAGNSRRDREQSFGLLHHNWTPKPAFDTFRGVVSTSDA